MAKQDEFIRITLRLPPELHRKLAEAAGAASLNAEIVGRLEASFWRNERVPHLKELNAEFDLLLEKIAKAKGMLSGGGGSTDDVETDRD